MSAVNIPDFFIVGAPKCGTSALASYLREHDNVFIPKLKEPHFFASNMEGYREVKTIEAYSQLFNHSKKSSKMLGEASVYYLYSKIAIKNISHFNKNSKIIVMLRSPVEMVYALHSQLVDSVNEDVYDFEEAWNLSGQRKNLKMLPKYSKDIKVLFYDEVAKYSEQLTNLYDYFSTDQVKIILFDDFKDHTQKVYEEILDFLDLPQNHKTVFKRINENSSPRVVWFNTFIKKPPAWVKIPKNYLKSLLHVQEFGLGKLLYKISSKKIKRKKLSLAFKQKIISAYKEDIIKLSKIIDRDLSAWMKC